jgi:hypothetical protein
LCHDEIHANANLARKQGWILDSHKIGLADSSASVDPKSSPSGP